MAKKNFKELADAIVTNIGGEGNVKMVTHCVTRLRFILKDESKADTEAIKKIPGVMTVVKAWRSRFRPNGLIRALERLTFGNGTTLTFLR